MSLVCTTRGIQFGRFFSSYYFCRTYNRGIEKGENHAQVPLTDSQIHSTDSQVPPSVDSKGNDSDSDVKPTATASSNSTSMDWQQKYHHLHGTYLSCLADQENLRVRSRGEVEKASLYSITKFAKDLLGIVDVLEKAIESTAIQGGVDGALTERKDPSEAAGPSTPHPNNTLLTGVKLTYAELMNILRRYHIVPYTSLNQKFDPSLHLGLFEVPRTSKAMIAENGDPEDPIVLVEQKKGYKIGDRILRPAEVGISR